MKILFNNNCIIKSSDVSLTLNIYEPISITIYDLMELIQIVNLSSFRLLLEYSTNELHAIKDPITGSDIEHLKNATTVKLLINEESSLKAFQVPFEGIG